MFTIKLIIYGILGIVLSMVGINALDNTGEYLAIMACVLGIDITSSFRI